MATTISMKKTISTEAQIKLLRSIRKEQWKIPIQFFKDPSVERKDKKKFVVFLHQKNWIFIRRNKNPPDELVELVTKFQSEEAFTTLDKLGRSALHKACLHELPLNEIENMLLLGDDKLLWRISRKKCVLNALNYACISGYTDAIDLIMKHRHGERMFWNHLKNCNSKNSLIVALQHKASKEIIEKLIKLGGRDLVFDEFRGMDALHFALKYRLSVDIIDLLIHHGGRQLVIKKDSLGRSKLFIALSVEKLPLNVIEKILRCGGKPLLQSDVTVPSKVLSYVHIALVADQAVKRLNLFRILQLMIEIGGKELMLKKDSDGLTPLHYVFFKHGKNKKQIIKFIVDCGGQELLMMKTDNGLNHLMIALLGDETSESIQIILDAGGKELLLDKDNRGMNSFEVACRNDIDEGIIKQLVKMGGKELCMNCSAQQCCMMATDFVSTNVFKMIIDIGGADLLTKQYCQVRNILQTVAIIFGTNSTGMFEFKFVVKKINYILQKGLQYRIGGEYALGGLLNSNDEDIQKEVFGVWNKLVGPAIELNPNLFNGEPLLQAAIYHGAPQFVIAYFIGAFDCINTRDSQGRRAVDVAFEHSLPWNGGMKDIIQTMAVLEKKSVIHICAEYGIKWDNGMNEVAHSSAYEIGQSDEVSGLYTFMLAAKGKQCDLSSIFELIRMRPDLITKHGGNKVLGQKRSRIFENECPFVVGKRFKQMLI